MNSEAEGVGTFSESAHSRLRLKKKIKPLRAHPPFRVNTTGRALIPTRKMGFVV